MADPLQEAIDAMTDVAEKRGELDKLAARRVELKGALDSTVIELQAAQLALDAAKVVAKEKIRVAL